MTASPDPTRLPEPIEAALETLMQASADALSSNPADDPSVAAALDAVRHAVDEKGTRLLGRPMSTAPRDGFAFLATGVHDRDDPPGAERGVKAGMPWWGILVFDIWRAPHRFVFAKDGTPPWSEPLLWCELPVLVGSDAPAPPLPSAGVRALVGAYHGLRSYQHGNAAPALAEEMADHCAEVLRGLGVKVLGGA